MFLSHDITREPRHMLWHVASGFLPGFTDETYSRVGWVKSSHRGVCHLDKFTIPKKEKTGIVNPKWEFRWNTAFEEVVRGCGDEGRSGIQKFARRSWITPELIRGVVGLRRLGYAFSFETWYKGELAGGLWGFQLGGFIASASAFFRVQDAGKAAWANMHLRLRDRGFRFIDWGGVPNYGTRYGVEWVPQWQFEHDLATLMRVPRDASDEFPCKPVPPWVTMAVPLVRRARAASAKLARRARP